MKPSTCPKPLSTGERCGRELAPGADVCAWHGRYRDEARRPKVTSVLTRPRCRRRVIRLDVERLRAEAAKRRWPLPRPAGGGAR